MPPETEVRYPDSVSYPAEPEWKELFIQYGTIRPAVYVHM